MFRLGFQYVTIALSKDNRLYLILLMIEELIQFRRELHQNPELSNQQFQTTKRIKAMAIKLGVREEWMTFLPTNNGLWIDICGQAPPQQKNVRIALRADIDALQMAQNNPNLPYKSVIQEAAHMCGHDGHATCMLALIPLLLAQISHIPSNKSVRLLFQPAQQICTDKNCGAMQMINHGCLEGVDQVYGYHNSNDVPFGKFVSREGPFMSLGSLIMIEIYGSQTYYDCEQVKHFALDRAIVFYKDMLNFIKQLSEKQQKQGRKFICTLPVFKSGDSPSVISEKVVINGTSRSFSEQATEILMKKITEELRIIESQGFTYKLQVQEGVLLINEPKYVEHLFRLARLQFGQQNVFRYQPLKASEDFGHYLKNRPGAYFFFGGGDESHKVYPHSPNYDFNDKLIELVSRYWMRLVRDRFEDNQP